MFAQQKRSRAAAALVIVSFVFLLAARSFPLAAQSGPEQPPAVAQAAVPGFLEQAGDAPARRGRLLPTLLGLAVVGAVVTVLVLTVFKKTGYNPHIIPQEFVQGVDNPYFPLVAGQTLSYAVTSGDSGAALSVLSTVHTRRIMGVLCLGVQDRLIADERLAEDTWRWYAQDQDGDVWYFARETKKYDYDVVTEDWSWQAGVNGAKPGRVMVGRPQDYVNKEFWQDFVPGVAEDRAQVLGVNENVTVPFGTFGGCVKIKVASDLEPGRFEIRFYAPGIGLVLSESFPKGGRRVELVSLSSN